MPKVVDYVGGLVRPLVSVWCWVEEVDVHVDEQEYSAVVSILLDEALCGVDRLWGVWVCPVCGSVFDGSEVCEFGLRTVGGACRV